MNSGINKYQLEKELKKALHRRNQDNARFYFYDDFLTIEYNETLDWIYSDWRGYQTESSIREGYEKLYEAVKTFHCSKVLNDNTHVLGMWTPVSIWLDTSWLPRMSEAGLKFFAWVCSYGSLTCGSTDESVRSTDASNIVQFFDDLEGAKRWLSSK